MLTDLANILSDGGKIDESECFIDASFESAKGGSEQIAPTRREKKARENHGDCGSPRLAALGQCLRCYEVTLVQLSFEFYMIEGEARESDRRSCV
jgi:hypothetical protein